VVAAELADFLKLVTGAELAAPSALWRRLERLTSRALRRRLLWLAP
jgi:hypothetical protein